MDTRSLAERDITDFAFTQSQYLAAVIIYSFGFGISIMATIAALLTLLQPTTARRFRLKAGGAYYVYLGYLFALLAFTIAYYLPTVLTQVTFSAGDISMWSPPRSAWIILMITLWIADGVLGCFLLRAWKGNRTIMVLCGLAILGIIVLDFTVPLGSSLLAGLYEFTAFSLCLARYMKSGKTNSNAASSRGHIRVPPPLIVLIGTGIFCSFRVAWIASIWGVGGSDIWANPIIFAFAVSIQCTCISSFSESPATTVEDDATLAGSLYLRDFGKDAKMPTSGAQPVFHRDHHDQKIPY